MFENHLINSVVCSAMKDQACQTAEKRGQVLEAAIAEFQEHGFAATNMDRIANRACVSKRTLYKYFESKENLFRSITVVLAQRVSQELSIAYEPGRDIRQQLTDMAWAEGRVLMSSEIMGLARLVISEILRNPELAAAVQEKMDMTQAIEDLIRAAAEDKALIVDDVPTAAKSFIALIKASAFWPVIFGAPIVSNAEMDGIIKNAVDMMMSRYAPT